MITRDKAMPSGAFTGPFYVVGVVSGLAIQAESTEAKAQDAIDTLNAHNAKNGHAERYKIVHEV